MASTAPASRSGLYADPREYWLAQHTEEIIDPARPIVDPHHHLWDRGGLRYMIEEMRDDIASGHNIVATVYVDCRSMYRATGPEAFRPVGEVEFANGVAAMAASGGYGPAAICAGIVSHVNLLLGDQAKPVLEAEITAGGGRFRGIRHSSAWDADPDVAGMYATRPKGLLLDPTFRTGFACLAPLNLSFDAWLFHPQIGELTELARGEEQVEPLEDVRLDLVTEEAIRRTTRNHPEVPIEAELAPWTMVGQPASLERAIGNLLDNAAKWSPAGSPVEVKLEDGELTVRDHGPGISEEDLPHVFERFYRATSARSMPGSGLGLAIVQQVAEAHHGSVAVEDAPGGGALLRLRLDRDNGDGAG